MQREDDDGLADLCRFEQFVHELDKGHGRSELQWRGGGGYLWRVRGTRYLVGSRDVGGRRGGGEPEIADHFAGLFCDEAGGAFEGGVEPVDEVRGVIWYEWLGLEGWLKDVNVVIVPLQRRVRRVLGEREGGWEGQTLAGSAVEVGYGGQGDEGGGHGRGDEASRPTPDVMW